MNNDWKPTEQNIGQPVKPSGDNLPYPYTTPPLKIGPSGYKLDPKKLAKASQSILPYLLGFIYFHEDYEYFDIIKPYLDLPEPRKSIEEIQQEFDEKIDELIAITKGKFEYFKIVAEDRYNKKFDRIIENFEYSIQNGKFMPKYGIGTLSGSYLVSNGGGVEWETSFVIEQGNKHEGYYTFGNGQYFKYYMHKKPNFVSRFFMDKLLGFKWIDEKNDQ